MVHHRAHLRQQPIVRRRSDAEAERSVSVVTVDHLAWRSVNTKRFSRRRRSFSSPTNLHPLTVGDRNILCVIKHTNNPHNAALSSPTLDDANAHVKIAPHAGGVSPNTARSHAVAAPGCMTCIHLNCSVNHAQNANKMTPCDANTPVDVTIDDTPGFPRPPNSVPSAAVALAHGLHASRIDGSPLIYNQRDVYMPDLLICRAELAERVLGMC